MRWTETHACARAGEFSVETQDLSSGTISTRYTAGGSVPGCTSTTISLGLYLVGSTIELGSSIEVDVTLAESGSEVVVPGLGAGTGAVFNEGTLLLSGYNILVGESVTVTVSGVNKSNANTALTDTYQYVFTDTCTDESGSIIANAGVFAIESTYSSSNTVTSTYRNLKCEGVITIKVQLNDSSGSPVMINSDVVIASTSLDAAKPLLGYGEGSSFIKDEVAGETELDGESETILLLNLVDPLSANALITNENAILEWFAEPPSGCSVKEFSVKKQSFVSGEVTTRYTTDLTVSGCIGTHSITALVSDRTSTASCIFGGDTSGCLAILTPFNIDVTEGIDPRLGTGEEDTFSEANMTIYPASIGAGSSALISVNIVDANSSPQYKKINNRSYGVTVTSGCASQIPVQASFTYDETIVAQGQVTFSYSADGCTGTDNIEVELFKVVDGVIDVTSSLGVATGTISIADVELGSIAYVSATAEAISISTIGDAVLPKQSVLTFAVTDTNGEPLENETVEFTLTNTTGGVSLAQPSDVSDGNGEVTAIINSGSAHTVVGVIAKVQVAGEDTDTDTDDVYIQTSSQPISVTTGIADQDSFQLSVDTFNPGAFDVNGTEVNVTVYAADQYQNPVANGTIVNFTAESGIVEPYCTTSGGVCSVVWSSSGVRPGSSDSDLERVNEIDPQTNPTNASGIEDASGNPLAAKTTVLGMTTIMAYTVGEAGYTDADGDGRFDIYTNNTTDLDGDGLTDTDINQDGTPDADTNGDGYIDVDLDSDGNIDIDANNDGIYDLDLNGDGDIDRDQNSDGWVDEDVNTDGVIDVDINTDGLIDVDNNTDALIDTDTDGDGFIDVDLNGDGEPDSDINADNLVDVDYNLDGLIDEDLNADGYIDEDDDSDSVIDAVDVDSVAFQAAVGFPAPVVYTAGVAIVETSIAAPVQYVSAGSALTEPYVLFGEAFRDDNWDQQPTRNDSDQYYVEFFADYDEDGSYDAAPSNGYQGTMCTEEAVAVGDDHCSSLMHVRDSVRIIQSAGLSAANIRIWADTDSDGTYTEAEGDTYTLGASGGFYVLAQDENGNIPPFGTTLTAEADGFKVRGDGPVANSLGILYANGVSRYPALDKLPSFGEMYFISYEVDGVGVSIELNLNNGSYETPRVLYP